MAVCAWCDNSIVGEPDKRWRLRSLTEAFDGLVGSESLAVEADFCCAGCAWHYGMREHVVIFGMGSGEAFCHLMKCHGLSFSVGLSEGVLSESLFRAKLASLSRMLRDLRSARSWS